MTRSDDSLLRLAVVGHTNVGKTSLMRTLMRDASFGQVEPTAATTRQVEAARLLAGDRAVVELYDTPGMEDAPALIERIEARPEARHRGPERIRAFLDSAAAGERFEQEARVLGQLLASDAAIYVVDAREPVLGKYQDELAILTLCARPILPVLNFVAGRHGRAGQWREALARLGLHAVAEFDTVVFSLESEIRLWQRVATLSDRHAPALERLIEDRRRQANWQLDAAVSAIADFLVDIAAARRTAARGDERGIVQARRALRESIAAREQRLVERLLALFRFEENDFRALPLPLDDGRWRSSPFEPALLASVGRSSAGGAAAGGAAGAAFDLATGGLSLGTGTLVGALAGGGAGSAWLLRQSLADRLQRRVAIVADNAVVTVAAARAFALLQALRQRGHAARTPIEIASSLPAPWPEHGLPAALVRARLFPGISTLNRGEGADAGRRDALADELAGELTGWLDCEQTDR